MISTKQNLVFYISHLNYGGAEKALLCLIPHLISSYRITLITDIHDSILYDQFQTLESNDFELVHVPYPFTGNRLFRIISFLSTFIGICINSRTHYFIALFLSNSYILLIFKLLSRRTKIVIWEHTLVSKHYSSSYPLLRFFCFADRILFPSTICQTDFLSLYPFLEPKVRILANPFTLDPSSFSVKNLQSSFVHSTPQSINIVVIGRLSIEKNVSTSIYCAQNLLDLNYNPTLQIYGSGVESSTLIHLVNSLDLDARVSFFGFSNNCWEKVRHDSIVLITSAYESFSMVALEALCLGYPVVSTPEASSHLFEDHPKFFVSRSSSVFDVSSSILDAYHDSCSEIDLDYSLIDKFSAHNIAKTFSLALP